MSFIIEKINPDDIAAIVKIDSLCYKFPWSSKHFQDDLSSEFSLSFKLVLPSSHIAGYVFSSLVVSDLQINNLCIAPPFRKKGYAQNLLQFLLQTARHNGAFKAFLEVRESNGAAINLYKKCGFNVDYTRVNFYSDGENAFVMSMKL